MAYKSTRRHWVKLWVGEWLDGTTRFELTPEQRLLWIDLLALAGRSRFPGMIYPGVGENEKKIGYPLSYLAGVLSFQPDGLRNALSILERHGHISVSESAPDCLVIAITNWDKYQSEYQRQKATRVDKVRTKTRQSAENVTTKNTVRLQVEGEGDVEGEGEKRQREETAAAFASIGFAEPFGHQAFQEIWLRESTVTDVWLTAKMERVIQECQRTGVAIPPQFYDAKRDVEAQEFSRVPKRVPL